MRPILPVFKRVVGELFLLPTHFYRMAISPWLPPSCIYTPTCSSYLVESVRRHGVLRGTALGLARIARCHHMFFLGGPDPVPDEFSCESIRTPYTIFRKHRRKGERIPPGGNSPENGEVLRDGRSEDGSEDNRTIIR